MAGKMSTGVCMMATPLRIKIRTDATMNVYGRLRATLTIHICLFFQTTLTRRAELQPRRGETVLDSLRRIARQVGYIEVITLCSRCGVSWSMRRTILL